MRRLTTEEFIQKCRIIHGDTYGYQFVKYVTKLIKVTIICKKHGKFEQRPNTHLKGSGCKRCGIESRVKHLSSSTEEFILKAKEFHKDLYDYSFVNYTKNNNKITIVCKKHGKFEQSPKIICKVRDVIYVELNQE